MRQDLRAEATVLWLFVVGGFYVLNMLFDLCLPTFGDPCREVHPFGWSAGGVLVSSFVLLIGRGRARLRESVLGQAAVVLGGLLAGVMLGTLVGFPPVLHPLEHGLFEWPRTTSAFIILALVPCTRHQVTGELLLAVAALIAIPEMLGTIGLV